MIHIYCKTNKISKNFTNININVIFLYILNLLKMNSNKDILDKAIGRPAMMGFMLLMGTYLVTGQIIPGWF